MLVLSALTKTKLHCIPTTPDFFVQRIKKKVLYTSPFKICTLLTGYLHVGVGSGWVGDGIYEEGGCWVLLCVYYVSSFKQLLVLLHVLTLWGRRTSTWPHERILKNLRW